ncbi:MAG: arginine--tRNA ligase, partial [Candidatus Thorarchaeota archaeon]
MNCNPEKIIIQQLTSTLKDVLENLKLSGEPMIQEISKKIGYGDYCAPIFQIAGQNKRNPKELALQIAEKFPKLDYLSNVSSEGGFVNFTLNRPYWSKFILSTIMKNPLYYKSDKFLGKKILIEHTSANPNGPIHIGNFRGSVIGDVYARLLKSIGADVITNFYIDDLGHQIPVLVIGYELYKKYHEIPKTVKIDHFLGEIYGITHTIYDIQRLKKELNDKYSIIIGKEQNWLEKSDIQELKENISEKNLPDEEQQEYLKQIEFFFSIQTDIYKRFKDLYTKIKEAIDKEKTDLPFEVPNLNRRYMEKEERAVELVRKTCEDAIRGQKEELEKMGIKHDNFDWEADLQWSGEVTKVLKKLEKNEFIIKEGKARIFDANKAAELDNAREYLSLKKDYEIPKAILITSTGDSLYLLRDIAYSIKKVDHYKVDKVYNVIGKQQELTQRQLNLAVRAVGRPDVANKLWHLNYEYMELKGALTTMSARRLQ